MSTCPAMSTGRSSAPAHPPPGPAGRPALPPLQPSLRNSPAAGAAGRAGARAGGTWPASRWRRQASGTPPTRSPNMARRSQPSGLRQRRWRRSCIPSARCSPHARTVPSARKPHEGCLGQPAVAQRRFMTSTKPGGQCARQKNAGAPSCAPKTGRLMHTGCWQRGEMRSRNASLGRCRRQKRASRGGAPSGPNVDLREHAAQRQRVRKRPSAEAPSRARTCGCRVHSRHSRSTQRRSESSPGRPAKTSVLRHAKQRRQPEQSQSRPARLALHSSTACATAPSISHAPGRCGREAARVDAARRRVRGGHRQAAHVGKLRQLLLADPAGRMHRLCTQGTTPLQCSWEPVARLRVGESGGESRLRAGRGARTLAEEGTCVHFTRVLRGCIRTLNS